MKGEIKASLDKHYFAHPTADVSESAAIGEKTRIWHHAQVNKEVKIGSECTIGKGVYIAKESIIGKRVKVQNYASLYYKTIIEDGVFIGPYVCLTNDRLPRAINPDGSLKSEKDWHPGKTIIHRGASIGTGTTILPDIEIGKWALVGAASLVTRDVPAHALAYGVPATVQGFVCRCGEILVKTPFKPKTLKCKKCRINKRW